MPNHLHLILQSPQGKLSNALRDFKKFTSYKMNTLIQGSWESRRSWMYWIFNSAGVNNPKNKTFQLWQQKNHPIELTSNKMMDQRLEYIHQNPVKARFVFNAEDYVYSSAINYAGGMGCLKVTLLT